MTSDVTFSLVPCSKAMNQLLDCAIGTRPVPGAPHVYIIDDDSAYLDSLATLVASMGFKPLPFGASAEFMLRFDGSVPCCVIIDLKLPDVDGLAVIEGLGQFRVPPPVIVLTGRGDVRSAVQAIRRGVVAYLEKHTLSDTSLWEAIQDAFARDAQKRAALARQDGLKARIQSLTSGEMQVFELLAKGHDHTTISEHLGVSRRTVENRRSKLMKKLMVENFADLIALAVEVGVI
jgi:two-component system response regulator FixJ